ncbi:MAG: DNA polymerase III subunit chi [Betaproteobacteria bacterium RIFCSPLOWO2_02_FULL_63_19]|nr:MAG: DNA polymerase III subunit chi [Betaproteobacteria bacterium RIFCSPLOWO2_02_FULL_63_19]
MTRIDFYSNAEPKLRIACQLAAKAVQRSFRVLILAPEEEIARAVDKMLWTFPATGFLPHCMVSDRLAAETPVLIARNCEALPHDQVLLNLASDAPVPFTRFQRLIELVASDEADKNAGRVRFRFYRDRGYEIHHHDLGRLRS